MLIRCCVQLHERKWLHEGCWSLLRRTPHAAALASSEEFIQAALMRRRLERLASMEDRRLRPRALTWRLVRGVQPGHHIENLPLFLVF